MEAAAASVADSDDAVTSIAGSDTAPSSANHRSALFIVPHHVSQLFILSFIPAVYISTLPGPATAACLFSDLRVATSRAPTVNE